MILTLEDCDMENLAFHIIKTNVIASFFILVVYITAHFLKAKYTAMWKYAAWLAIAVFLLIPVNPLNFAAPFRLVIPETAAYSAASGAEVPAAAHTQAHSESSGKKYVQDTAPAVQPRQLVVYSSRISLYGLLQLFIILWSAGFLLLALYRTVLYHFSLRRLNRWSLPEEDRSTLALYFSVCRKQRVKKPPKLMVNTRITSPVLAGLTKTKMYIPAGHYSPVELQLIFSHELSHYRCHDLWYKLLLLCVTTIYWFNPTLYLMRGEAEKDVENLRDGNVLKHCAPSEQQLYAQLLLKTAAGVHFLPYLATSLNDSTMVFKERIRYMVKQHTLKPKITPALLLTVVLLLCSTLVGCTAIQLSDMPRRSAANKTDETKQTDGTVQNEKKAKPDSTVATSPAVFGSYNLPAENTQQPEALTGNNSSDTGNGSDSGNTSSGAGNGSASGNSSASGNASSGAGNSSSSGTSSGAGNGSASGTSSSGTGNGSASGNASSGAGNGPATPEMESNSATISGTILTVDKSSFEVQNPNGTTDWYWYDPGWVEFSGGGGGLSAGDNINFTYYTDTKEVQSIYTG